MYGRAIPATSSDFQVCVPQEQNSTQVFGWWLYAILHPTKLTVLPTVVQAAGQMDNVQCGGWNERRGRRLKGVYLQRPVIAISPEQLHFPCFSRGMEWILSTTTARTGLFIVMV